jgi:hypothetical protein
MENAHFQIVDLGKMLVAYKKLRLWRQMRRTLLGRIDFMEGYPRTNGAQLVASRAATA